MDVIAAHFFPSVILVSALITLIRLFLGGERFSGRCKGSFDEIARKLIGTFHVSTLRMHFNSMKTNLFLSCLFLGELFMFASWLCCDLALHSRLDAKRVQEGWIWKQASWNAAKSVVFRLGLVRKFFRVYFKPQLRHDKTVLSPPFSRNQYSIQYCFEN